MSRCPNVFVGEFSHIVPNLDLICLSTGLTATKRTVDSGVDLSTVTMTMHKNKHLSK